jgi:hypothetical protein
MSSGGAASGGKPGHSGPIGGQYPPELTRGGFGESMPTFHDGKTDGGTTDDSCNGEGEPFFVYEVDKCLAASACLSECDPRDSEDLTLTYRPGKDPDLTVEFPAQCRTVERSSDPRAGRSYLVLPCDRNSECPFDLVCVKSEVGDACFVRDIPWAPNCTDAYCIKGEVSHPGGEYCDRDIHCCAGHICSPESTCERLECGLIGYHCDESSPGAVCCDGLVCSDGTCQDL